MKADKLLEMVMGRKNLQKILNPKEMKIAEKVAQGEVDLYDYPDLYDKLFNYYLDTGQMPYGTAKARTGDPDVWIASQLAYDLDVEPRPKL